MRPPICLAVYWSHLSLLPKPCEPAGLFQSSLMVGWRSQGELSYMCHENWLLLREGLGGEKGRMNPAVGTLSVAAAGLLVDMHILIRQSGDRTLET